MAAQPIISVGIMAGTEIRFSLFWNYRFGEDRVSDGDYVSKISGDKVQVYSGSELILTASEIVFEPLGSDSFFELKDVTIGINFHWEQKENQRFRGGLKILPDGGKVCCISLVPLEEYLKSVISSEMSAMSSPELLKAHAVISRSWLLAQIEKTKQLLEAPKEYRTEFVSNDEIVRWYDREDHTLFDVCADDHCQRYQGITKIFSEKAIEAVEKTWGEVLISERKICDARFSKCCGGVSESFENAWEPEHHSYLVSIIDNPVAPEGFALDLKDEANAEKWIRSMPPAFCNTSDKKILSQVLPGFDQATTDFFRWKVEYSQQELSVLIKKRSGIDFGEIICLEPLQRGDSGRIVKLKIMGTKRTLTVGKELEIRKWLSESHLYSSAFVVDSVGPANGIPQKITLAGAGWGHGVGLCQIGAALMAEKGYSYRQILAHYYHNTGVEDLYQSE